MVKKKKFKSKKSKLFKWDCVLSNRNLELSIIQLQYEDLYKITHLNLLTGQFDNSQNINQDINLIRE